MIKAVIFGFNGVLYNSTPYMQKARDLYFKQFNIKRSKKELNETLGWALKDQINFWNKKYELNLDYENFSKETRKLAKELMTKFKIKPNYGVVKLINNLKQNNFKIGIVSFFPKKYLIEDLEILGISLRKFDAITALEDIKKYRPDPEFLLNEAGKLKVNLNECLYISDDNGGLSIARSIGMKTIGLTNKFQKKKDFESADRIVNSLNDLTIRNIFDLDK